MRHRPNDFFSSLLGLFPRADEPQAVAAQFHGGEAAAHDNAAVHADAMRQGGRALGGVAVHYRHRLLPIFAAEEGLADTPPTLHRLCAQRAIGLNARMLDDVAAHAALKGTTLKSSET